MGPRSRSLFSRTNSLKEWKGDWSDDSSKWNDYIIRKVEAKQKQRKSKISQMDDEFIEEVQFIYFNLMNFPR